MGLLLKLLGLITTAFAVWLGWNEYTLQRDLVFGGECTSLQIGQEAPGWNDAIASSMRTLLPVLEAFSELRLSGSLDDHETTRISRRIQHPVAYGCVNGTLHVTASAGPGFLKHQGKSFPVELRLSKGGFTKDRSLIGKVTGIALKIRNVSTVGRVSMEDEEEDAWIARDNKDTVDLLLVSTPTLPLFASPKELVDLHQGAVEGGGSVVKRVGLARPTLLGRLIQSVWRGRTTSVVTKAEHFSVQATRFGEPGTAVRWSVAPCKGYERMPPVPAVKDDYVAEETARSLQLEGCCMELRVQHQRDVCQDRLEDLSREWSTPWEKVAEIRVERGSTLVSDERCEGISYNPHHTLEELRPLGWVARMRRKIYAHMAAFRRMKNGEK